jgi:glucan biosynthesis protein C
VAVRDRIHALDAVRAIALLSGVFLHASVSFWPGVEQLGYVADSSPSLTLASMSYVIHVFRMTMFFLIAGFFAHLLFHRRGLIQFLRDRVKRIGIPLVVGWILLDPAVLGMLVWGLMRLRGQPPLQPFHEARFWLLPMQHLWFLRWLLWLYVVTLLLRAAFVYLGDRSGVLRSRIDGIVASVIGRAWGPLALAAPLAVLLYIEHDWVMWFGIPTPPDLFPNLPAQFTFGMAFTLGWLLRRQPRLLEVWGRRWSAHAIAAVAFTSAAMSIIGIEPVFTPATRGWHTLAYAVCYSVAVWASTFAFVGAGVQFLSGFSALRRYISDASYWIYLAHLPIVLWGQYVVRDWPLHWTLKFLLLFTMSLAVLFATYHLAIRSTWIGAIINGRRHPRRPEPVIPIRVPSSLL